VNEQVVKTWRINQRVNEMLLDAISDEGFACTLSTRGGRTVALQFAHLHNVRLGWLEVSGKDLLKGQKKIDAKGKVDRALLKRRLSESADGIAKLIEQGLANEGKLKGFRPGVIPMLGYLLAHDAHHRGSILLTLKQCGHKVPPAIQYGIWEWGTI
jgi:uncharacterized damage-inducible protein DinB